MSLWLATPAHAASPHSLDAVNSLAMAPFLRKLILISIPSLIAIIVAWALFRREKPPQPVVDHPRLVTGVAMSDVVFFSHALQRDMTYRVFLPQKKGASNPKLPVVYLLHGGGGNGFRDWSNDSDVDRFALHGLVLVMPEGDYSYYTNAALQPQDRYEDYITIDLPADVARRFPVGDDRGSRTIVGVSMGGFGAIKLALRHPEQFAFAGALSPAIDAPRRRFSWRRLDQSRHFQEIFGPDDSASRQESDPFLLARRADPATTPYLYLTCGQQESLLEPVREFSALLDRYHIAHEFHAVSGGHDWNQWNSQLPLVFDSLANHVDAVAVWHKQS